VGLDASIPSESAKRGCESAKGRKLKPYDELKLVVAQYGMKMAKI
jgi:hypothetical protein